ncbi:Uncharacterised protein [Capnocytophaga canimorsus]|nr:hypothetical protein CLV61_2055 [Capnocytophaga canimorsus]STA71845.1 Uncharacterised protein [Capnocytophaga canimorsus]
MNSNKSTLLMKNTMMNHYIDILFESFLENIFPNPLRKLENRCFIA